MIIANITSTTPVVCNGQINGQSTSSTTGGKPSYTYLWDNGVTTANNTTLNAGTHILTVTDSKGCSDTAKAIITQPAKLVLSLIDTNPAKCYGLSNGEAIVGTTGGNYPYTNYNWSPSTIETDSSVNTLAAGMHKVIVTDTKGCKDTLNNIVITQPDTITLSFTKTMLC
ncbi:MAG: SprB repeat-containing protein [Bacteroidetes bacterium]|nr:SprB repeat-containing protein [Bacteroidota bacterium]